MWWQPAFPSKKDINEERKDEKWQPSPRKKARKKGERKGRSQDPPNKESTKERKEKGAVNPRHPERKQRTNK